MVQQELRNQHIRLRMPKLRGNQFYLPTVSQEWLDRYVKTFCGATPTTYDLGWADRKTKWTLANACPACVEAVKRVESKEAK